MKKAIIIIAAATLLLNGCQEKWMPAGAGSGNNIWFSASRSATKTVYNSEDDLQIDWVTGDRIKIYCAEAEDVKEATYSVTRKETFNHGYLTCVSSEGLKWGGDTGEHNFFAVYPASSAMTVEGGIATCTVNANQICTVNNSGDNLIADPDMTNAYMVANLSTEPVDKVELHFRPIMTTLKITIRAKEQNQSATITGVSITSATRCYDNTFGYNIENGTIIEGTKSNTVTTFIGVKNGSDSHVDLENGQTLTLTAFIPPVDINSDNPVKIRLHAQNSQDLIVTLGKTEATSVAASTKRLITLPHIPSVETVGNNWITPLDDNIYVSQLSIPGTHDACTSEGLAYEGITGGLAKTQTATLNEQWDMGIRAFDFRPAQYRFLYLGTRVLQMYHGIVRIELSFNEAMSRLTTKLADNPGEFAIVLMRHESEAGDVGQNQDRWGSLMYTALNDLYTQGKLVMFRPDLTVGDCRGKILVMSRDEYDNGPIGGYMNGWSFNPEGSTVTAVGPTGISGTFDVQDYYDCIETAENRDGIMVSQTKIDAIKALLRKSASNTDVTRWTINHTSGYTRSAITLEGYRDNAAGCNPEIYAFLNSQEWLSAPGPIGIMMMDFVGARRSGSTDVYGDLLPQTIIDNNYKYHMVRKQ